jgi:hypothetical protein
VRSPSCSPQRQQRVPPMCRPPLSPTPPPPPPALQASMEVFLMGMYEKGSFSAFPRTLERYTHRRPGLLNAFAGISMLVGVYRSFLPQARSRIKGLFDIDQLPTVWCSLSSLADLDTDGEAAANIPVPTIPARTLTNFPGPRSCPYLPHKRRTEP